MFFRNLFLLAVGLAAAGAASAQSLGKVAEFYFEADANTVKPIIAVKETGDSAAQMLLKRIARNPQAKAEHAQLAHIAMESGRVEIGHDLYTRAFARIDRSDGLWRALTWNYGWDLFRAGDAAGALQQWSTLQAARNVTASWIPPTNALVLWTLGRKDEAVQWYAAAVRTEPQQWRTPGAYATLLPEWRDSERATLAEVQAAWAANPPTWP
jgi:Tfp pilus assembly protein PilF